MSACSFSPSHKTVFSIAPFDRQCFTYLTCILIYPSDSPPRALGPASRTGSDLMPVWHTRALPGRHAHVGTALGTPVPPAGHGGTMPAISPSGESETALQQRQPLLPHPAPHPACCPRAAFGAQQAPSCRLRAPPYCPWVVVGHPIAWLACARPDSHARGAGAALASSSSSSLLAPRGPSAAAPGSSRATLWRAPGLRGCTR